MKAKKIMLLSLSIILLFFSYLYREKILLFNIQYRSLTNKIKNVEKYYNYAFFTSKNKKELSVIKALLDDDIYSEKRFNNISKKISQLEYKVKNNMIKAIRQDFYRIISKKNLIDNKYMKLNLNTNNQKLYNQMISSLFKEKEIILGNKTSLILLDVLFEKYQMIGSYKLSYVEYLKEDKLNILKLSKKQDMNSVVRADKKSATIKKRETMQKQSQYPLSNKKIICSGTLYSLRSRVVNKQDELLNRGVASSVYQIDKMWCLTSY